MKKITLVAIVGLVAATGFGQQNRIPDRNALGWYTYNGDHKLSEYWALHTEYQWRRIDFIRTWQQSLARLSVIRTLTDRINVSSGYTFFITYPYGNYPVADAGVPTFEHRSHEDIELSDKLGRLELAHRIRLEQRWLSQSASDNPRQLTGWEYQNRIRYQLSGTFPLVGSTIDDGEFYVNAFDELFLGFGRNVGNTIYNQNRISGGLGYQIRDNVKLELNYLNQISQHPESDPVSGKPVFETNNGFRLNVSFGLDFSKRKTEQ